MNLFIILIALAALSFQWPSNAKKTEQKSAKVEKVSQSASTAVNLESTPTTVENISPRANSPQVSSYPEPVKTPLVPRVPNPPSQLPPQINAPLDIGKVQKQLDDLVRLNQNLKANYRDQVNDIERITQQAKIHQQILSQIQSKKPLIPNSAPLTTEIEKQQALLAISQEASKSRSYLENLKPQNSPSNAKVNQKVS